MAADPTATTNSTSDVLLQYVVLRRDLWQPKKAAEGEPEPWAWPLGAVVAQGCHASTAALWLSRDDASTQSYCSDSNLDHMHKAVLEVKSEAQLRNLSAKLDAAGIKHKLWIEQPENYATCLATAPLPKSVVYPILKKFNLCKSKIG
mmetsp:Transcript_15370/g.39038  ORF Transcript_15370/g.39038 Transcript_15370/m.39038 type:complete len:147 (-) Transcript_15370:1204-1644(-)